MFTTASSILTSYSFTSGVYDAICQQPDVKNLDFRWNDGYAEVKIPRLDIHSTIVVSNGSF